MSIKDSEKDQKKDKALQESDNKFRSYIENAPDGVFVTDDSGRYLEVNRASENITGYTRDELLSMSLHQLSPPEGIEEGIKHFAEVCNTGRASGELEFLHKNGSKRWWLVDAVKLSETRYLGFTKDITESKRAEDLLRESNHLKEQIINCAHEGIIVYGMDLHYKVWNPFMESLTGLKANEVLGKHPLEVFPFLKAVGVIERLELALKGEFPDPVEFPYEIKAGRGWTLDTSAPLRNSTGEIVGVIASVQEITKRKQTEEKLRESENRYRLLHESSGVGIGYYTPDGIIISFNALAMRHMNGQPEDFIGKSIYDIFPKAGADIYFKRICKSADSSSRQEYEDEIDLPIGTRWFQSFYTRIQDSNNKVIGVQVVSIDITDRKKGQEQDQLLSTIIKQNTDFIGIATPDQQVVYVNPAGQNMVGLEGDDDTKKTKIEDYFLPEDLPFVKATIIPALLNKGRWTGEFRFRHFKTGKSIDVFYDLFSLRDPKTNKILNYYTVSRDITEQKKAEEALKKSEEKYRNLIKTASDAIYLISDEGVIIETNNMACSMLEMTENEIKQMHVSEIDPNFPDNDFNLFWEKIPLNTPQIFESIHKKKDGKKIPVEISGQKFSVKNETFYYGIARDITERKQAEEALRASEEMMRNSQSVAHICSYSTNLNLKEIEKSVWVCSPEFYKIFGIDETHPQTIESWVNFIHPDQRKEISDYHKKVVKEKGSFNHEYKIIRINDGAERWVHGTGELEFDEKGTPIRMHGAIQDITESKDVGLALAAEKERLAVTLRSIGDGVITTDTKGNIFMLNKVAEALTGWSSNEAIGHSLPEVFNIINENTRERCENPVERVLATGSIIELENHTCLIAKDGREIVIADSGAPIRNNESQIIGVVLVFRDMTEKQKLEEAFQNSQKLESLGILAGGIAHDFNNYLSGIFGYIELAMAETEHLPSHSKSNKYLQEAINIFQNAKSLTQQLLTFAKGGAPKKTLANISIVFERSINFALSGSNIIPILTIDDDLWPSVCDENRIGQCFDNLIINALQAMPKGGEIIFTAENCALESKNYLKITIQDSGCGINQDKLQKIFDPFFTTKETGHGLGLATVYSIIKNHDGWIDVESKIDVGTTFTIYLPAVKEELIVDKGEKKSNVRGSGTILVMDDQPYILELYKVMLEKLGYTVIAVDNVTSAIEQIKLSVKGDQKIRACFLDLTLPGGKSGIDVAKEIKEASLEIVNIATSGYSDSPVFSNPEKYGFNDSIEKPFSGQDLSRLLEKYL
jgi:PAS domain S-box-containing protein